MLVTHWRHPPSPPVLLQMKPAAATGHRGWWPRTHLRVPLLPPRQEGPRVCSSGTASTTSGKGAWTSGHRRAGGRGVGTPPPAPLMLMVRVLPRRPCTAAPAVVLEPRLATSGVHARPADTELPLLPGSFPHDTH